MKVKSTVIPAKFKIWDEGKDVRIRLRGNIEETVVEYDGNNTTEVEYDEVEVVIANRHNIKEYVEENFEALFDMGAGLKTMAKPMSEMEKLRADIEYIAAQTKVNLGLSDSVIGRN